MRRGMKLCLWALAAAVLAFAFVQLRTPEVADAPAPSATEAPAYTLLYTKSEAELNAITVTLADGESYQAVSDMVFDDEGNLLGVRNSLAQPLLIAGREDFRLDATAYQMLLLAARNLPYTARYEGLDAAACGLQSPSARLEMTYASGDPITLRVGDLTASGASCYVQREGDAAVYLVPADFWQIVTKPLDDLHRLPTAITEDPASAVQIAVVSQTNERIIATRDASEGRVLPWRVDQPITHDATTASVEAFLTGLCAVHADSYVATVADTQGLSAYGLDAPTRLIAAFSDGVIRDLHIGADAGDGCVYARLDTTGDVYRVSREQLAFAEAATLDGLLDRFVALVPIQSLQSVTAEWTGGSATFTRTVDAVTQEESFTIGGESVERERFTSAYADMIGLRFDRVADASVQGAPVLTLRFTLTDGSAQTVSITECNDYYHLASTDGGGAFLVRRERVDALLAALAA